MSDRIRRLAAGALCAAEVRRLPVRLSEVARRLDIRLFTYGEYAQAAQLPVREVVRRYGADGFVQRYATGAAVFYSEGDPRRMRWTVAHELAHLLLGHLDGGCAQNPQECDRQADRLAAELLCPSAVVAACGCDDSLAVAELCDVSQTAAQGVWRRGDCTPFCDEELQLAEKCGNFIAQKRAVMTGREAETERLPRLQSRRI